jgi:hypothetical protein
MIITGVGVGSVVSTETTGKGLADHAISTAKDKDCKIVRSIKGEDICQPESSVTVSAPAQPVVVAKSTAVDDMERIMAQRKAAK